jgi:AbrB family looped-hinge helix DNA binding protein
MWYTLNVAHAGAFAVQLGDRGRLVLPAAIRRQLELKAGDELLIIPQPDGSLRIASARLAVRESRGLYRTRTRKRSLVNELIADRRLEVARERPKR